MADDRVEVVQSGRETWLAHPYTGVQRKVAERAREKALKMLFLTCANSSDPDVLRKYFHLKHIDNMIAMLTDQPDEEDERKSNEP